MTPQVAAQLGVCSWSLGARDVVDLVRKVQATGVGTVQLALTAHRGDPGAMAGVQDTLWENGIEVVSGMFGTVGEDYSSPDAIRRTGGIVPDQHWEENWRIALDAAAAAERLGLRNVSMHAGFLPHDTADPSYGRLTDRLVRIAGAFAEKGVDLLFETGQEDPNTLLAFFDALERRGATNVGANFDPANMLLYDMADPIDSLAALIQWVKQVHLKDGIRPTTPGDWGTEVTVGTGHVDWPAFMRILAEDDFIGGLIVEREAGDDRVGDIQKGIEYITGVMSAE